MPDPDFAIPRSGRIRDEESIQQQSDLDMDSPRASPGTSALLLQLVARVQTLEGSTSAAQRLNVDQSILQGKILEATTIANLLLGEVQPGDFGSITHLRRQDLVSILTT